MSVQIQLDQHDVPFYTNLDFISGRVILTLLSDATVSAINVKLEAESRTRLAGPRNPHDRPDKVKTELEVHKLLYKVQTVFPGQELLQHGTTNPQFTLAAGRYEYPFKFKFPFNNDCKDAPAPFQDLKFGQLNVQFAQEPVKHLKRALPPSMSGFPGEAEIKYYIKATVVRPKFYQENLRYQFNLRFLPIERPRPEPRDEEQYARRQYQFQSPHRDSKLNLFKKASDADDSSAPSITLDARLPSPAIITCHRSLPLRVFVQKTNNSPANIYLKMFHLELIAFTDIKAHDLKRTEITSWVLVSKANMDMVLDSQEGQQSSEIHIPTRLWDQIILPNNVAPSFETCNVSRKYELEVRVGLSHSLADQSKPEVAVLPLRLPCEVFSGITPPAELLQRIKTQTGPLGSTSTTTSPNPQSGIPGTSTPVTTTPLTPARDSKFPLPPSPHSTLSPSQQPHHESDDLPPSYEDAMAEDIGPFDGPREHFESLNSAPRQQPAYSGDSKSSGGLNRHPSERLFSQNAPRAPGANNTGNTNFPSDQTSPVVEEPRSAASTDFSIYDSYRQSAALDHAQNSVTLDILENINDPPPPPLPARKPQDGSTTHQDMDMNSKRSV